MRDKIKKYLKIISISLFFLAILAYGIWRAQDLINGVPLDVTLTLKHESTENTLRQAQGEQKALDQKIIIRDGDAVEQSAIEVSGTAKQVKILTLNGQEVFLDKDWKFNEEIVLLPGYNIITIIAEDKFGKRETRVYRIINNSN